MLTDRDIALYEISNFCEKRNIDLECIVHALIAAEPLFKHLGEDGLLIAALHEKVNRGLYA